MRAATPLFYEMQQRILNLEEQLIAHIHLVAEMVIRDIDTTEANDRLKSTQETLDSLQKSLAALRESQVLIENDSI
jgi:hypothetical protein